MTFPEDADAWSYSSDEEGEDDKPGKPVDDILDFDKLANEVSHLALFFSYFHNNFLTVSETLVAFCNDYHVNC